MECTQAKRHCTHARPSMHMQRYSAVLTAELMTTFSSGYAIVLAWPCVFSQNCLLAFYYCLLNTTSGPSLQAGKQLAWLFGGARGGIFALHAHCALLLDYVPPKEPPSTPWKRGLDRG